MVTKPCFDGGKLASEANKPFPAIRWLAAMIVEKRVTPASWQNNAGLSKLRCIPKPVRYLAKSVWDVLKFNL